MEPTPPDYLYYESFILAAFVGGLAGALVRAFRHLNRPRSVQGNRPIAATALYILGGMVVGVIVRVSAERRGWTIPHWDWILAATLGGLVGVGELVSRYRDEPIKAILSIPALLYVVLNAGVSILALALGREFKWFPPPSPDGSIAWSAVLSAGLGAMVVLRSSIFRIRVAKDKDIDVGPSSFLQTLLDAADQAVDHSRAQERAWAVASVMENVASDKALAVLPSYISALMQNLKPEDQGRFEEGVKRILEDRGSERVKSLTLGLLAMNYTGEGVLRAAVASLATQISDATAHVSDVATGAAAKARDAKVTTEQAAAAAKKVEEATQATDAPSDVKQIAANVVAATVEATKAAQETLHQTEKTAEAAQGTAAVAAAAQRTG